MRDTALPREAGAGFKPQHFAAIASAPQPVGFFEIHAENYLGAGGRLHAQLTSLRERYPLSIHGVALNLGSCERLDACHLARVKELCDRYQPASFSEHLAWSSFRGTYLNDLLPIPYTEETLRIMIEHVDEVQEFLGRRLLLENPATYVRFAQSSIQETEFLCAIARVTGCGLLLDINNVFVAAANHGFGAQAYLDAFPLELVGEIHLAGHFKVAGGEGRTLLIDAHDSPVISEVLALFDSVTARTGPLPTLIEWDNDIPEWPVLREEVRAAQSRLERALSRVAAA